MPHLVVSRSVELTGEDAALMQRRDASVSAEAYGVDVLTWLTRDNSTDEEQ